MANQKVENRAERNDTASGGERKTSDRILDAAEILFAEQGFEGTAVRDIATRVQLNPASLYNHFPSKQVLYEAVLERRLAPVFAILIQNTSDLSDPKQLENLLESVVEHLSAHPTLPRLMQHEALTGKGMLSFQTAGRTLRPLYARGLDALRNIPAFKNWCDEDIQLFMIAFHQIIFGHFAMSPLLEEVMHEPPLSPAGKARLIRFLKQLLRDILSGPAPTALDVASATGANATQQGAAHIGKQTPARSSQKE